MSGIYGLFREVKVLGSKGNVEFVSYDGKYPNLCSGVLVLKIDGEEVRFGHNYLVSNYLVSRSWETDGNYDAFWSSGGSCYFSHDYSESGVNHGRWEIDIDRIPDKYKDYYLEIEEVFNDNVDYGCCGGCL